MKLGYPINKLLKDVILAEFLPMDTMVSQLLHIPQNYQKHISAHPARVIAIGSKFRYKGEVIPGDIVYVPVHFGNTIDDTRPMVRMFDGEDVLAKQI